MRCPACGVPVSDDATYCHRCGTRVATTSAEEPVANEPAPAPHDSSQLSPAERLMQGGGRRDEQEQELWEGSFSWKGMAGTFAVALVLSIVVLIGALLYAPEMQTFAWTGGAILLVWLLLLALLLYRRLAVHYRVTTQRFVHQRGILRRITDRIEMIDIDDVSITEGIIERMLGTGTVVLHSSDASHPELALHGIDGVRDVAHLIDAARRQERIRRGLHIESV